MTSQCITIPLDPSARTPRPRFTIRRPGRRLITVHLTPQAAARLIAALGRQEATA